MRDAELRVRIERVEAALGAVEDTPRAVEALRAVIELYGEALRRVLELTDASERLADDELIAHLLLIHDLHPLTVEARIMNALEEVRPYLGTHGGDVELLAVEDGVALVRLNGTCDGCPSSAITLKRSIEAAILRAAPELERVEAAGLDEAQPQLLQIGSLAVAPGPCLPEAGA